MLIVILLVDSTYQAVGIVMLLARLSNVVSSLIVIRRIFGAAPVNQEETHLVLLMDNDHFLQNAKIYGILCVASLFDATLLNFLPWNHSKFATDSQGYPDLSTFKICMYTRSGMGVVIVLCQSVYMAMSQLGGGDASVASKAFLIVNILFSASNMIISLFQTAFITSILEEHAIEEQLGGIELTVSNEEQRTLKAGAEAKLASIIASVLSSSSLPNDDDVGDDGGEIGAKRKADIQEKFMAAAEEYCQVQLNALESQNRNLKSKLLSLKVENNHLHHLEDSISSSKDGIRSSLDVFTAVNPMSRAPAASSTSSSSRSSAKKTPPLKAPPPPLDA